MNKYVKKGASKIVAKGQRQYQCPQKPIPGTHTKLNHEQINISLKIIEQIEVKINMLINFTTPIHDPVKFNNATTHINYHLKQIAKMYEDEKTIHA